MKSIYPGILLISFIVVLSKILSNYIFIGSIACAIILGFIVNQAFKIPNYFKPGIKISEYFFLNAAIILLGSTLDLSILYLINIKIVSLLILLITVSIFSSLVLGKIFNLSSSLSLLIGIGNGVCGSSAIAAASRILNAKEDEIGLSISTINILGAFGIFILPLSINLFFSGSLESQGIIVGSTIQSLGQVTASGFMMGNQIGETAIFVKMIRILMLGPILITLTFLYPLKISENKYTIFSIPSFIIGFVVLCLIANLGIIPKNILLILSYTSKYCLLFSMVAIGLNISLKSIVDKGYKVFIVALLTFGLQIFISIYFLSGNY